MKISCPSCAAKYSIADEKVQDRLAKIRCRKCDTTIVIDGRAESPEVYAADAAGGAADSSPQSSASAAAGGTEYSVDYGEGDQRTMLLDAIVEAYNNGEISAETYVWADGMDDWAALGEVEEIVEALHGAVDSSASAAAPETPWTQKEASPEVPRAAVGTSAAAGGEASTDLFGGYAAAGSEEDVTTSAPQDPGPQASAATGARNESSVLFSLSALTSAGGGAEASSTDSGLAGLVGPSTNQAEVGEDSGLIDLGALAASAPQAATPIQPAVAPAAAPAASAPIAPPLGLSAPLGAPLAAAAAPALDLGALEYPGAGKSNKLGLYIGGAVFAGIVVLGAIFILKPSDPPPAVPSAAPLPTMAATATPPEPEAEPEATAKPEQTAKPPSTGSESDEEPDADKAAAPTKKPAGTWRPKRPTTSPTPATSRPTPPTPATKPAAPKANPCGCAPGDLKCAMRCAATG